MTGSELVGLISAGAVRAAGKYFLEKHELWGRKMSCTGVSEAELIRVAERSMNLSRAQAVRRRRRRSSSTPSMRRRARW